MSTDEINASKREWLGGIPNPKDNAAGRELDLANADDMAVFHAQSQQRMIDEFRKHMTRWAETADPATLSPQARVLQRKLTQQDTTLASAAARILQNVNKEATAYTYPEVKAVVKGLEAVESGKTSDPISYRVYDAAIKLVARLDSGNDLEKELGGYVNQLLGVLIENDLIHTTPPARKKTR